MKKFIFPAALSILSVFCVVACFGEDRDISCDSEGSHDDCPEGTFCGVEHLEGGETTDELICQESCVDDEECPSHRPNCTSGVVSGEWVCSEAAYSPRSCEPEATGEDCECGIGDDEAYLVEGTGEDCVILEEDVTACFEQTGTCRNGCANEFFRHELGDGTAIIATGLNGSIGDGWDSDGQALSPISCPAIEDDSQF